MTPARPSSNGRASAFQADDVGSNPTGCSILCTHCRINPRRAPGQRNCTECHKAAQKQYRKRISSLVKEARAAQQVTG
jgi:hypothetical protein